MEQLYTVNQLAEELGITPRALRFYEDKGLLAPKRVGNNRVYTKRDRARLMLILRGKRLGFSLAEIREYLDLYTVGGGVEQLRVLHDGVKERRATLEQQRLDLEATLAELKDIEDQVLAALAQREAQSDSKS